MTRERDIERHETIVIGGGQAGLCTGFLLARRKIDFVILDAHDRIGDAWRSRWDSLRLFTPARLDALPGMRFPAPGGAFPTKDEMADYLETYARRWSLPVRTGMRVTRLSRAGDRFVVETPTQRFEANEVVVAMANYQTPKLPAFARELDPDIVQLHADEYQNPSQLKAGGVLVVGVGNSGADIAMEVARDHPTYLAGKESGHIPWRTDGPFARTVMIRVIRFIGGRVLSVDTPIGRKARPKLLHQAAPLIRVKPADLTAVGISRTGRVVGVREGRPVLGDDRVLDVANVIWCTGFQPGFSWIDLPVFDEAGDPLHESGIVPSVPGLYFLGLQFLHSMTSATVTGVGRDAKRLVKAITARVAARSPNAGASRPAARATAAIQPVLVGPPDQR
jgi:putative flavoprotein involved in K+ transport